MSAEGFDGAPLVAGSVTATRVFAVDSLGRLRSTMSDWSHKSTIITPGVNRARCQQRPESHEAPDGDCECGYYAYSDTEQRTEYERRTSPNVHGVIEASGRVIHGTKGVRAEKMRVVAVVDPTAKEEEKPLTRWQRFSCWTYTRGELSSCGFMAGCITAVLSPAAGICLSVEESPLVWLALAATVMAVAFMLVMASAHGEGWRLLKLHKSFSEDLFARVVRNYPDVQVYPTWEAMLDVHPVTPPPAPREPSPEDEDFWTRAAA